MSAAAKRRLELTHAKVSESGLTLTDMGFGGDTYVISKMFKGLAGKEIHLIIEVQP